MEPLRNSQNTYTVDEYISTSPVRRSSQLAVPSTSREVALMCDEGTQTPKIASKEKATQTTVDKTRGKLRRERRRKRIAFQREDALNNFTRELKQRIDSEAITDATTEKATTSTASSVAETQTLVPKKSGKLFSLKSLLHRAPQPKNPY